MHTTPFVKGSVLHHNALWCYVLCVFMQERAADDSKEVESFQQLLLARTQVHHRVLSSSSYWTCLVELKCVVCITIVYWCVIGIYRGDSFSSIWRYDCICEGEWGTNGERAAWQTQKWWRSELFSLDFMSFQTIKASVHLLVCFHISTCGAHLGLFDIRVWLIWSTLGISPCIVYSEWIVIQITKGDKYIPKNPYIQEYFKPWEGYFTFTYVWHPCNLKMWLLRYNTILHGRIGNKCFSLNFCEIDLLKRTARQPLFLFRLIQFKGIYFVDKWRNIFMQFFAQY